MAMATIFIVCVFFVLTDSVCQGLPGKQNTLVVFGDSVFDPGNNKGNSLPYGETYFGYPTGRESDGRIVPDFIAQFAQLSPLPAFTKAGQHRLTTEGANFASISATVVEGGDVPFPLQLNYFKNATKSFSEEYGEAEASKVLNRAVYLFSIGSNNYIAAACSDNPNKWRNGSLAVRRQFVGWVVAHIISAVEDIYKLGGRKFAFQNSGPLGLAPAFKANSNLSGCPQECTLMARLHNRALPIALQNLEKKLPEPIKYGIFDFYNSLGNRAKNPTKYGFKVGNASCCGVGPYNGGFSCGVLNRPYFNCSNPNEYVWFDGGHNTDAVNHQLAQLMWSGPPNVVGPYNVQQLFDFA